MSRINWSELLERKGDTLLTRLHEESAEDIHRVCGIPRMMLDGPGLPDNPAEGSMPQDSSDIYSDLTRHQQQEPWFARDSIVKLQTWAKRFNDEFKLRVPEYALRVDVLPRSRLGHFRYGHNGFGLRGEIAINARYMQEREPWQILGTLLHEFLHAWQQAHGTPGKGHYHNRQFRDKAHSLGLLIDKRGFTQYLPDSLFFRLLQGHDVDVPGPKLEVAEIQLLRGRSKMKKWSCGCTNVRCAVATFRARCLKCGREFVRAI